MEPLPASHAVAATTMMVKTQGEATRHWKTAVASELTNKLLMSVIKSVRSRVDCGRSQECGTQNPYRLCCCCKELLKGQNKHSTTKWGVYLSFVKAFLKVPPVGFLPSTSLFQKHVCLSIHLFVVQFPLQKILPNPTNTTFSKMAIKSNKCWKSLVSFVF